MVTNPVGVEFNYRFSGDRLQVWDLQVWGDIQTEFVVAQLDSLIREVITPDT